VKVEELETNSNIRIISLEVKVGKTELEIFGTHFNEFSFGGPEVIEPPVVEEPPVIEEPPIMEEPATTPTPQPILNLETPTEPTQRVPDWVRNIVIWYAEERISEDELLDSIQFLIDMGILTS